MKYNDPAGEEQLFFCLKDLLSVVTNNTSGSSAIITAAILGNESSQEMVAEAAFVAIFKTGIKAGEVLSNAGTAAVDFGAMSAQPEISAGCVATSTAGDSITVVSSYAKYLRRVFFFTEVFIVFREQ